MYNCAVDDRDVTRPPAPPLTPALPRHIAEYFESLTSPGLPGETAVGHGRRPLLDLFPSERRQGTVSERPRPSAKARAAAPVAPAPAAPRAERRREGANRASDTAFALSADPRFFYHSTPHDNACQQFLTAIRRHEGLVVLIGAFGAGKTILCRTVFEQLDRRTLTSFIIDPFVTGEDLLKQILADFGVLSHKELARDSLATRRELSTTLLAFVESLAPLDASAVVIVDEAQNLPPDAFDQVRMLCEAAETSARLQVVLVGQPALGERLRRPENKSLHVRVAVRCSLDPLPENEVADYIAHRIGVAGTNSGMTFDNAAIARIFGLSQGVPRMVNLVCERALARAHEASTTVISESLVDLAAVDLDMRVERPVDDAGPSLTGIAALVLSVLAGAAAAARLFRDAVARVFQQWH